MHADVLSLNVGLFCFLATQVAQAVAAAVFMEGASATSILDIVCTTATSVDQLKVRNRYVSASSTFVLLSIETAAATPVCLIFLQMLNTFDLIYRWTLPANC